MPPRRRRWRRTGRADGRVPRARGLPGHRRDLRGRRRPLRAHLHRGRPRATCSRSRRRRSRTSRSTGPRSTTRPATTSPPTSWPGRRSSRSTCTRAAADAARLGDERRRVVYDPYDAAISADPFPTFRRLRDEAPIYRNEHVRLLGVVASRRRRAGAGRLGDVLEQPQRHPRDHPGELRPAVGRRDVRGPAGAHAAPRADVARVHAEADERPRGPGARRTAVRTSTRSSAPAGSTSCGDLGQQMPMRVIGMLLGIPESDQAAVRHRADAAAAHRARASRWWSARTRSPTARCSPSTSTGGREHPSDDLMTVLLNAEFEDDTGTVRTLTRDEVLTYTQVARGRGQRDHRTAHRLARQAPRRPSRPAPRARRAIRSLIPNAIEETLRFQPTGLHLARYVTRDVELPRHDGAGRERHAAARRLGEPRRASLRPIRTAFDVRRDLGQHLTFGVRPPLLPRCRRSRSSRVGSRSTRCSRASPTGRSTRSTSSSHRRRRSAAGSRCRVFTG